MGEKLVLNCRGDKKSRPDNSPRQHLPELKGLNNAKTHVPKINLPFLRKKTEQIYLKTPLFHLIFSPPEPYPPLARPQ
jgi:hypothetical protein